MTTEPVRVEREGGLATIFLDRPPVNAIELELRRRADAILAELENDSSIGAVVLTGAGACFSAGLALKLVPRYSADEQRATMEAINRTVARLYALPLPTVAAVNGHAIAG